MPDIRIAYPTFLLFIALAPSPAIAQRIVMLGAGITPAAITYSAGTIVIAANSPATLIEVLPNDTVITTSLATIPGGGTAAASGITASAGYIVGSHQPVGTSTYEGVIWSLTGAMTTQTLASFAPYSALYCAAVTPAGELIAGGAAGLSNPTSRPFVWSSVSGTRFLATLTSYPSNTRGLVYEISKDGTTAVGSLMDSSGMGLPSIPVVWRLQAPGDAPLLLDPAVSGYGSYAGSLSPNGRSFAGMKTFTSQQAPVVWLEADGQLSRRLLDPGNQLLAGSSGTVLDDGLVAGRWLNQSFAWQAFIWHPSMGSNHFMEATQFFASHGVASTPTISRVSEAATGGGMHHFVVEDSNGVAWYIATATLGPNTNRNPAFTTIGTGTTGAGGFQPALSGLGSGQPGTTTELQLQSVNPGAVAGVALLGLSLASTAMPGPLGLRLDPTSFLGTLQIPVTTLGGPGSNGAALSLLLPSSLIAGQQFAFQAALLESSGALIVSNALALTVQ